MRDEGRPLRYEGGRWEDTKLRGWEVGKDKVKGKKDVKMGKIEGFGDSGKSTEN
jgi:hypothetical protein